MARPLRVEFDGAWYHVMNRGAGRQKTFLQEHNYKALLDILEECCQIWSIQVHAYCLMPNHYHLLVHTPKGNLSRAMRHLNSVYTQHFNRAHQRDGALFRGRYKAIVVDADSYLLQVVRYIHLNPLKARLCENPQSYPWSSYRYFLDPKRRPKALTLDEVLGEFGQGKLAISRLEEFTLAGIDPATEKFYSEKKTRPILGSGDFIEKIKDLNRIAPTMEIPDSRRIAQPPSLEQILELVSQAYEIPKENIIRSQRRVSNEARQTAIYLARYHGGYSLHEIAQAFGCCRYSTIGNTLQKVRIQFREDADFQKKVIGLTDTLFELKGVAVEKADKSKMEI